jgi:hypothetical protein
VTYCSSSGCISFHLKFSYAFQFFSQRSL